MKKHLCLATNTIGVVLLQHEDHEKMFKLFEEQGIKTITVLNILLKCNLIITEH
jgi:hypothetical protein